MWEDLLNIGESAWETVGESAEVYVNAYVENKAIEDSSDSSSLSDSVSVNNQSATANQSQETILNGVSNNVLIVGGALVVGLIFVLALKGR